MYIIMYLHIIIHGNKCPLNGSGFVDLIQSAFARGGRSVGDIV